MYCTVTIKSTIACTPANLFFNPKETVYSTSIQLTREKKIPLHVTSLLIWSTINGLIIKSIVVFLCEPQLIMVYLLYRNTVKEKGYV